MQCVLCRDDCQPNIAHTVIVQPLYTMSTSHYFKMRQNGFTPQLDTLMEEDYGVPLKPGSGGRESLQNVRRTSRETTQTTIENLTHCMVILPLCMSRYNQVYITSVHSALGSLKCISLGSLSPAYQPNKTKDTPPGGYHNLGGGRKTRLLVCRL